MNSARATNRRPSMEVREDIITGKLLDLTAEGTPYNARQLRLHFQDWLGMLGASPASVDDLCLAVYEALANVVEHAYHSDHADPVMHLRARLEDDQLLITITDQGCWSTPQGEGSRGRGLAMMRSLTAEADLYPSAYGTTMQLRASLRHRGTGRPADPSTAP